MLVNEGRVSTLLIHWNFVAIWLVFFCSIAIVIGIIFANNVLLRNTRVSRQAHPYVWSIGQWIAQYLTYKVHSLLRLSVCGSPFVKKLQRFSF